MDKNILLLGCGYWGNIWYKTLLKSGHKFSVVEARSDGERNADGIEFYTHIDEVKVTEFTHAIVATPASTHVSLFNTLLVDLSPERILIEKPCGTSLEDAEKLGGCYPGYLQLHSPAYRHISENISKIGTPCFYKSIRASMGPRVRTDGSIVEDYLVHDLYIFMSLFGQKDIRVVSKNFIKRLKHHQLDTVFAQLYSPGSHVFADMFSSWWYPYKERRVIISGDRGTFMWIDDNLYFTDTRYEQGEGQDSFGNFKDHLIQSSEQKIELGSKTTVESELETFLNDNYDPSYHALLKPTWKLMRDIHAYTPFTY
jgi:predicted dehydrogenase